MTATTPLQQLGSYNQGMPEASLSFQMLGIKKSREQSLPRHFKGRAQVLWAKNNIEVETPKTQSPKDLGARDSAPDQESAQKYTVKKLPI